MKIPIAPPELLSDHVEEPIKDARVQARRKGPKRRIRVRERRGRQHLTGRRKIEMVMMRETVGGGGECDVAPSSGTRNSEAEVVAIAERLALIDTGQ